MYRAKILPTLHQITFTDESKFPGITMTSDSAIDLINALTQMYDGKLQMQICEQSELIDWCLDDDLVECTMQRIYGYTETFQEETKA